MFSGIEVTYCVCVCGGGVLSAPFARHQPSFAKGTLKLWVRYRHLLGRKPRRSLGKLEGEGELG